MRARMAIHTSQIKCELREVLLRNKPKEMISISPKGTVPVLLLDDGTMIEESIDIMKWSFSLNDPLLILKEYQEKKNEMDFKTSVKLSGSRFVILKKNLALLERALINFMLDVHTLKFNYTEISPPLIATDSTMFGTGQLPKFENDNKATLGVYPKFLTVFAIPEAMSAICSAEGLSCIFTSPMNTVRSFETIIDIDRKDSFFLVLITLVMSSKHLAKGLVTPVTIASASPAEIIEAAKTFLS